MGTSEARRTFAALMQKARSGSLTGHDRTKLSEARQTLRRSRRPAMNPAKKERFSVYSYDPGGGSSYRGDASTLGKAIKIANTFAGSPSYGGAFIVGKRGAIVWDSKHPRKNPTPWTPSPVLKVARELEKFGFSKAEARRLAAQAEGERGIGNVRETVERIVRAHTHRSVGGERNPSKKVIPWLPSKARRLKHLKPLKKNPAGGVQRIGQGLEVRYKRTIGRKPGYYKHTIRSRRAGVYTIPAGWVYVADNSILITETEPKTR